MEVNVMISQPRYIPAINYLNRIMQSEIFIILDTVQRNGRSFENRNRLLLPEPKWLTIPIVSGSREQLYKTKINNTEWIEQHKENIKNYYKNHPHFNEYLLNSYYKKLKSSIQKYSYSFPRTISEGINFIIEYFQFNTKMVFASDLQTTPQKGPSYLKEMCLEVGGTTYISGPNGRNYGVIEEFKHSNIKCQIHDFEVFEYNQYNQSEFFPYLAFWDLLFSCGEEKIYNSLKQKLNLSSE